MDFGIGFLSNNVMLPILDFFYGLVPSYGLAIIALTLVIRFALFPLSAGAIRNARRMRIANPAMQKRQQEIRERYKDDPAKMQQEMAGLFKEFGNPLSGCFPLLLQMPILFALFATLRGSPFADVNYTFNVQVLPKDQIAQIQPAAFTTSPNNIFINDGVHERVAAILPGGTQLGVGQKTQILFQTPEGKPLSALVQEKADTNIDLQPRYSVTRGAERVSIAADGALQAIAPGEATIQATIPGLAANKGFLFIKALGGVGVNGPDGIKWDVVALVLAFGISLYVSQQLSGQGAPSNPQQDGVNRITPIIFSGMFLFFPLPAGVLMYMVIANLFQTLQTFILMREPLPEGLQKIVEEQQKQEAKTAGGQDRLPFEPAGKKKAIESSSSKPSGGKKKP